MTEKQVALVTGGSRGIGRAICIRLAESGVDVCFNYAHDRAAAEKTVQLCKEKGVDARAYQADITSEESVKELFQTIEEEKKAIQILVNNAGVTKDNLLIRMTKEEFDGVMDVNMRGAFFCTREAAKAMLRQRYGRIISIASIVGVHGNAGQINYAAAKAGLIGMTKTAAKELARKNITVNAIAPGMIDTDMLRKLSEEQRTEMKNRVPAKRLGDPKEVAEAVAFFASPVSAYITGQVLCVDGGMAI